MRIRAFAAKELWALVAFLAIVGAVVGYITWEQDREREAARAKQCSENLRWIANAKEQYQMVEKARPSETPTGTGIIATSPMWKYARHYMTCPSGGKYIIGRLDEPPRCTYPGPVYQPDR